MKKLKTSRRKISTVIISLILSVVAISLFLLYGPWHGFRDLWITTAMTTLNHQYLAKWLYKEKTIQEVLTKNQVIESNEEINTDLIEIYDNEILDVVYKDEYDKQVLERDKDDVYKYFKVDGYNFDAYMAVIYDPSKIKIACSKYLGEKGQYLTEMASENNALVAINGGGFTDVNGESNGGEAKGIVIKDGRIIQKGEKNNLSGGIIGFTNDNKLYLANISAEEAVKNGVRDAVEFRPFLIVNGTASFIKGNGGYGIHPRTAIGQRKDGIVLFLVVDGRRVDSLGASMKDLTDIMLKYGAYNAANLDGGNSSALVIENKIVNHPIDWFNVEKTRPIPTAFIVTK